MSEFLKNLRSNQSAYSNGNRKGHDSYYHPNRERRGDSTRRTDNRRKYGKESHTKPNPFSEVMPLVNEVIPKILETFERIALSREKLIQSEERKTDALEQITVSLTKLIANQGFNGPHKRDETKTVAEEDNGDFLKMDKDSAHRTAEENRKRVVEIIQKMRDENYTYDHIAHYLTEHQFPTFSHRGDWHAQTVHRLFRKGLDPD